MEITNNDIQLVSVNQNVLFTETPVPGNCSIIHREGSGLVTLRGMTNQCRARYRVTFGGNIAVPNTGAAAAIQLAIAVSGEAVATTTMIFTPNSEDQYGNVFSSVFLDVPKNCCSQISVKNISDRAINVRNANLIVERVA